MGILPGGNCRRFKLQAHPKLSSKLSKQTSCVSLSGFFRSKDYRSRRFACQSIQKSRCQVQDLRE
uniref:Putative ovule protein n=1 Tax=Solanum chacoense TaxID=4108 RepID=A0A0V0GIQ7_SOLCH